MIVDPPVEGLEACNVQQAESARTVPHTTLESVRVGLYESKFLILIVTERK
jgi:hypothetical protein